LILTAASSIYAAAAVRRRQWYARHPHRRRHLGRPVISIGNLSVGGSGKTPLVARVAELLRERGERPAILIRGYARQAVTTGVTIVSDGRSVQARIEQAGDEALMLARALPGVAVLVGADRHASGTVAEQRLKATVHVLDDGFQHLRLARDLDLLVVHDEDLSDRVLPAGRLREPLSAAASADALLLQGEHAERLCGELRVPLAFRYTRSLLPPRLVMAHDPVVSLQGPAFAVAGIARPRRFLDDLAANGWQLSGEMVFPDHHPFDERDIARIERAVKESNALLVLTTEKDAVRLEDRWRSSVPLAAVPLKVSLDQSFAAWLDDRLAEVRSQRAAASSAAR
jgi:tetraacyldisaccharide 4'-kinase